VRACAFRDFHLAGAVTVSPAASDKRLSDELLEAVRESIKVELGLSNAGFVGRSWIGA
jgi:hypothetical protein